MPTDPLPPTVFTPAGWEQEAAGEDVASLQERALHALKARLPELAEVVAASLPAAEPAYYDESILPQEPAPMIGKSIENALAALRIPADKTDKRDKLLDWPRRVGERCGRQGMSGKAVRRAYELAGKAVANALTRWTVEADVPLPRAAALLDDLWDIVDEHAAAALAALRATEMELLRAQTADVLLDALLNGATDASTIAAVARSFAMPEQGRYAVIVRRPTEGGPILDPVDLPVRAGTARLIWRLYGESAVGVAVLGTLPVPSLAGRLPTNDGFRTGVSMAVTGLATLGRARRLAELASRTLPHGLAILEEQLPAAILTAQPDLAHELKVLVLAPVLGLDPVSRDLLLNTFAVWLRSDGSAAQAATALCCHRNTVLNRLRRLERLTLRSLTIPRDLVELSLALEAFQLQRRSMVPRCPSFGDLTPWAGSR
ncbi:MULTISPECIES: helix-turn-helix domain-containing protein [unclassified Frankia]|uniref:helix-turn-helix domain-containing protein n=1 Tax=unclassified Frankia TaxID=2632575 RepID=UPI001EF5EA07|nr:MULTISPECIES: helix-turn-helix domain-containing protein [unclassified Frankia]